jgi:flagellar assembly protein FliH
LAVLRDGATKLIAEMQKLAPAELVADATVSPGGCRVDTQFGCIDQQIEAQLARIRDELSTRT